MKLSIVMAVYNGERYLQEAIDSMLAQTFTDFEFVIVNDGSVDGTAELLDNQDDGRVVVINRRNNLGLAASLNEGIERAKNEYIARMDADDVSLPDRLEIQVRYLEANPEVGLCGTWATIVDRAGRATGRVIAPPLDNRAIRSKFIYHNTFVHPTVVFRKEVVTSAGYYNPYFKYAQDYELWSRVVPRCQAANVGKKLLCYRESGQSMTAQKGRAMRWEALMVRRNLLPWYLRQLIRRGERE